MTLEGFIARRYLISKRSIRFINVITIISIAGITLGVAALLVALSVFNGFNSVVTSVLVGFDPHLRIEKRGNLTSSDVDLIGSEAGRAAQVSGYAPFVSGKAMLIAGVNNRVVFVRGLEPEKIDRVSGLQEAIVLGSLQFEHADGEDGILIGAALADRLMTVIGDKIDMISPRGFQASLSGFGAPQTRRFRVAGIFESNNRDYDAGYAFISLEAAIALFGMENQYNGVELRLSDFHEAEKVKAQLNTVLPSDFTISTWYDLHRNLYAVMTIERWSGYILLCLIIVVATFNMLGSLTMTVIEKRRDIAVLKSMGMTASRLVRMFLVEGLLVGAVGTVLGILLGLFVLFLQVEYHLFPLDPSIYIIPAIPVEIRWVDFVAIPLASMGLSFFAAFYPARRAAATVPAEAIRWE